MKSNEEGFNRSIGGMSAIDSLLTSNKLEPRLRSSVIHSSPISEANRRFLKFVSDHKGCTANDCAKGLELSRVIDYLSNFVGIGYIRLVGGTLKHGRFYIEQKGIDAINRTFINHGLRNDVINKNMSDYERYVPPKSGFFRAGAMDAVKLPSK